MVVDDRGAPLPEREVGHIVVGGPSLMRGYFEQPAATDAVLKDGWLWTGDLGYLSRGHLFVTGRTKDLIILRGRNYYAEDLERAMEAVEGVRAGASVAFGVLDEAHGGELAVAVCETKVEEPERQHQLADRVCAQVLEVCGVKLAEVVLVPPGTIPRTSSGKRQRALCRDLYLAGELAVERAGVLRLAMVFARSGAGFIVSGLRRMMASRRAPD
jgi:acyl-CoA synthetase (AMP-forming)/AMP-acid ligase II